jgi:hypothetical protein
VGVSRFLPPAEVRPEDAVGAEGAPEGGGGRVQPVLDDLAALRASERARFVRRWGTTLERRQGVLQASASRLEGRIGDLRARMEEQYAARSRLVARRDAVRES